MYLRPQMLIRGLGWPAAETQRPGPPGQGDPLDAGGVLAGPGLRSAEEELKAQLLALQVVSDAVSWASVLKGQYRKQGVQRGMPELVLRCGLRARCAELICCHTICV